jgi:hypothetical protein
MLTGIDEQTVDGSILTYDYAILGRYFLRPLPSETGKRRGIDTTGPERTSPRQLQFVLREMAKAA